VAEHLHRELGSPQQDFRIAGEIRQYRITLRRNNLAARALQILQIASAWSAPAPSRSPASRATFLNPSNRSTFLTSRGAVPTAIAIFLKRQSALQTHESISGSEKPNATTCVLERSTQYRGWGIDVEDNRDLGLVNSAMLIANQGCSQTLQMIHPDTQCLPSQVGKVVGVDCSIIGGQ
jgi:hypothetical protein